MGLQEAVSEAILEVLMMLRNNLDHVSPSEMFVTKWCQICNPELQPRVSAGMRCPKRIPAEPQSHVEGWNGLCRLPCCDKTADLFKAPRGRAREASAASASSSLGREPSPGPRLPGGAQGDTPPCQSQERALCVCVMPGRGLTQLSLQPIPMLGPAVEMQAEPTASSTALQCGHGAPQGLSKASLHLGWGKRQGEADCSLPCNPQSLKIVQHLWLDKTGEIIPFQPPCPGLAAPHQISCPGPWAWQWAALPGPRCTLSKQFPPTSNPNYSSLL